MSGPFTGACQVARTLLRAVTRHSDSVRLIEKHGGVPEPVARLIDGADGVAIITGIQKPAIIDAFGRSLVEREIEYAGSRNKSALAVLVGRDIDADEQAQRLRRLLRSDLGGAALDLPELDDRPLPPPASSFRDLSAEVAVALHYGQQLPRQLSSQLPQQLVEVLSSAATAGPALARIRPAEAEGCPTLETFSDLLERLSRHVGRWLINGPVVRRDQVFISYSHADTQWATRVEEWVEKLGLRPWRDVGGIQAGADLQESIVGAIASSRALVALWSDDAIETGWVEQETRWARRLEKELGIEGFVIPMRVPGFPVDRLPERARGTLTLTLDKPDEAERLLAEVLTSPRVRADRDS